MTLPCIGFVCQYKHPDRRFDIMIEAKDKNVASQGVYQHWQRSLQ
ncbi:hypothetical protein [Pseudomonas sp.]